MRRLGGYLAVAVVAVATFVIAVAGDDASGRAPITAVLVADGTVSPVTITANPWRSPTPSVTRTPSVTATPGVAPSAELAPAVATAGRQPGVSAEPSARLVVANTGGEGVLMRPEPGSVELVRGWAEGTELTAVGPDREAKGRLWKNVRDPEGAVGWIAVEFLRPASP
ncbi:MAG: hypothetical protein ACYC3S_18555 [Chloroflexota bacterium]